MISLGQNFISYSLVDWFGCQLSPSMLAMLSVFTLTPLNLLPLFSSELVLNCGVHMPTNGCNTLGIFLLLVFRSYPCCKTTSTSSFRVYLNRKEDRLKLFMHLLLRSHITLRFLIHFLRCCDIVFLKSASCAVSRTVPSSSVVVTLCWLGTCPSIISFEVYLA